MSVGVVGAGITGLALTHYLAERGVESVAVEAAGEPGGVIDSRTVDGRVLEAGPQRLRLTPGVEALVEAVGLADRVVTAPDDLPLFVYADGGLGEAPFDAATLLRTDLLSWRGKLRLLAEPLTRRGRPEETVGGLFARKFGTEAYRKFVGPLYGGIYGSDPAAMPARHALAGLLERERETHSLLRAFRQRVRGGHRSPPATFRGGLQALPEALYDAHRDRVELGTPATGLEATADGYRLETADGARTVDHVVVTTPADVAADLLAGVAESAAGLADLTYNPLAVVHLRADLDRQGMGYQVARGEPLRTLGVSWNDSLFGRDGVYTAFLGGMDDPEVLERPDGAVGEIAAREFETATGAPASVTAVTRLERGFPAYDHSWAALDALDLPGGVHLATNYTARMGIPSRVREARELADALV